MNKGFAWWGALALVAGALVGGCGNKVRSGDDSDGGGGGGGDLAMNNGGPETRDVVDPKLSSDLPMQFDGVQPTVGGVDLVYPNPDAIIPHDLAPMEVQWNSKGTNVYRVTFAVDTGDRLRGYVDVPLWLPSAADWQWLLDHARGHAITLDVAGGMLDVNHQLGSSVSASPGQPLHVSVDDATGALFYFATTGDQTTGNGTLERLQLGSQTPDKYLNKTNDGGHCVGCHTLTRDGSKLAFTFLDLGIGAQITLGLVDATDPTKQLASAGTASGEAVFSPDGSKLLLSYNGKLQLRDGATGALVSNVATSAGALYPDWSPDGTQIVFTRPSALCTPNLGLDFGQQSIFVYGGSLVTMDYANGAFGNEKVLLAAGGSDNNYYPAYSPDGAYVAFTRSDGKTGSSWSVANTACNGQVGSGISYDNPSATLWIVSAKGGGNPIALAAANGKGMLTDSWPKWGPKADGEYLWLSFTSTRPYGNELPGAPHQLWITAVKPQKGEFPTGDVSAPPVWFPFQDMTTKNHIGVWSVKVGDYMIPG